MTTQTKDFAKYRKQISLATEALVLFHGSMTAIKKAFRDSLLPYSRNGKVTFGCENEEQADDYSVTASIIGKDGTYYDIVIYYAACRKKRMWVVTEVDLIA